MEKYGDGYTCTSRSQNGRIATAQSIFEFVSNPVFAHRPDRNFRKWQHPHAIKLACRETLRNLFALASLGPSEATPRKLELDSRANLGIISDKNSSRLIDLIPMKPTAS